MTWENFRTLFESEYVANRRPNTRRSYEITFDAFEEVCHPARLASITQRTLSLFAAGLRDRETATRKGNQASTIKLRLQVMRTTLRWAAKQKMITECPVFPSIKVPKKKPQPIPTEAFERLYAKAEDDQMRALLLSGWLAGLRRCEALALEREPTDTAPYLDLPHERIVLPAEFAKADEDQWIPLDPVLREALLALPNHGPRIFRFVARDGHEVGLNAVGLRVITLAAQAGVKLSMHSLRKGFGCRHAAKVPAQVLQRLMRHSDIKVTMNFYANVDDAVREAILGSSRTGSRANPSPATPPEETPNDVTSYPERRES
jgi:integrase